MSIVQIEKDTWGRLIEAGFNDPSSAVEIIERSDGYVSTAWGPQLYFSSYKTWPENEKEGLKFAGSSALDVGCGAGRVCLHLQNKGVLAVGIDISRRAIKVCRKRGIKNVIQRSIDDIGRFKPAQFDSVFLYNNNFGLFRSRATCKKLLKRFARITSPDGVIIAESSDISRVTNAGHRSYQKQNVRRGRLPGQLRLRVRYERYASPWFDYLLVTKQQMRDLLNGTEWRIDRFIQGPSAKYTAVIVKRKLYRQR